jgi:hypothetical protein
LALEVCQSKKDAEPAEFEAAVRLFVRQSRFDLVEKFVEDSKAADGPYAAALSEALLHERHPKLPNLVQRLLDLDSRLLPNLARVIGHQRLRLGTRLLSSKSKDPALVWALGRLREPSAAGMLYDILATASEKEQIPVALALLRITNDFRAGVRWPLPTLGLLGKREFLDRLCSDSSVDSSLALGLLGETAAIPSLILRLPQPEAALALQLITGAGLTMQTPVDDEDLEVGERPTTETKLECGQSAWSEWWNENENDLPSGCLRCGIPNTAQSLLQQLWSPERLHIERYWLVEQLAIRDGVALDAEMDMYRMEQLTAVPAHQGLEL